MNASVISRLVGILSSKDSHLRSNELDVFKYNDVNTNMDDRWSVKLMIFFSSYHLNSMLTIPLQKKKEECEETRDAYSKAYLFHGVTIQ